MVERAAEAAVVYASVPEDAWQRTGRRKAGQKLTATARSSPSRRIGRYHLHDVVHHLWDVTITPARAPQEW